MTKTGRQTKFQLVLSKYCETIYATNFELNNQREKDIQQKKNVNIIMSQ